MSARRWVGASRTLTIGMAGWWLLSCSTDSHPTPTPPQATAETAQALNLHPSLSDFALYAQRSITLGDFDQVSGGDIGVAAAALPSFGSQLVLGAHVLIDPVHNLLSPSTTLGSKSQVGDVQTTTLTNDGATAVGAVAPYPAPMPQAPPAAGGGGSGSDVTVGSQQSTSLSAGSYGALTVGDHATVTLGPGTYSFSGVSLADHVRIVGDATGVTLFVSGSLGIGGWDQIAPAGGATADKLAILVGGTDGSTGTPPAASVGLHSQLTALLAAPHGTLAVADHVHATGALSGFNVSLSDHSQVTFQAGFSNTTGGTGGPGRQVLHNQVPPVVGLSQLVSSLPGTMQVSLAIGLPLQVGGVNGYPPLDTFIQEVSAPHSTVPGLSTTQFATGYGPPTGDYTAVQMFATDSGLAITQTFESRNLLVVTGPVSTVEQAFAVNLNLYQRPDGTQFFAPANDPSVVAGLPTLLYVSGLTNASHSVHWGGTSPHVCNPSPIGSQNGYDGPDIRAAYLSGCTTLEGQGQTIALVESGGFYPSDIIHYCKGDSGIGNGTALDCAGLSSGTLSHVQQRGFTSAGPLTAWVGFDGTTFDPTDNQGDEQEQQLDIDMVLAMAPQANILLYQNQPVGAFGLGSNLEVSAAVLLKTIAEETDVPKAQIISSSISWNPEENDGNVVPVFQQFAAQRQSYFSASGDWGALVTESPYSTTPVEGAHTKTVPAGLAWVPTISTSLLTAVGGTELTTSGTGGLLGGNPQETTWNDVGPNGTGRGYQDNIPINSVTVGGFVLGVNALGPTVPFDTLPIPTWQLGVQSSSTETSNNPLQARMIPDVAWLADGLSILVDDGTLGCSEGTSAAAPLWAGFAALVNQLNGSNPPLGFASPALYAAAAATPSAFNDIADYSNNDWFDDGRAFEQATLAGLNGGGAIPTTFEQIVGLYHATPGYDMATGLGTPTCRLLTTLATCTGAVCGGSCVDLDTDPHNCGACGKTCLGSTVSCVGGICGFTTPPTIELNIAPTSAGPAYCVLAYGFPSGDVVQSFFMGAPGGALANTFSAMAGAGGLSADAWYFEGNGVNDTSCSGAVPVCTFSDGMTSVNLIITDTTLGITLPPVMAPGLSGDSSTIPACYWCGGTSQELSESLIGNGSGFVCGESALSLP